MPRRRALLVWCALATAMAATAAAQQQVYRVTSQSVPVYATVIGPDGRLVTDLTRDDFEVFDDGRPQPLVSFDAGLQPINVVVMLDMSGSMRGNLATLRASAVQFFTRLLPQDRARVGNFGDRIVLSDAFTNDTDTLIRALYLELQPGGATPLWRAIDTAMDALARLDGRRVVLVLSDGRDSVGPRGWEGRAPLSLDDVRHRAQADGFMIYAIGMRSQDGRPSAISADPDPGLRTISGDTGGGYFELRGTDDLGTTFARVADELHRQYLLGYAAPVADGRVHLIRVRVRDPHMNVRARQSYVAPRESGR